MTPSTQPTILMIGNNTTLTYLISRYAERSGYNVYAVETAPSAAEVCDLQPAAVLFPSVENLEAAQALVADLSNYDVPLLVCSSAADEDWARELGADNCLLHPLMYENFLTALTTTSL